MANPQEAILNAEKLNDLQNKQEKTAERIKKLKEDSKNLDGDALKNKQKRIALEKEKLSVQKKELKLYEQLKESQDEVLASTDKEAYLNFDIAAHKKKLKKTQHEITKLYQIGTKEAMAAAKQLKKQYVAANETFESKKGEIAAAQTYQQINDKLLTTMGLQAGALGAMKDQMLLLNAALMKNPYLLIGAALAGVVMALKKGVTFALDLQKSLGTSAQQSIDITKGLADPKAIAQFKLLGVNVSDTIKAFGDSFGDVNLATKDNLIALGKQQKLLGISTDDAVKLSKTFMDMTGSTFQQALDFQNITGQMAEMNGLRPGDVVKDLAENTEMFATYAKDGGLNLARAAVQARKLGASLQTTSKIADSLLDFESSIEKEMEASLMIGKQLNFNRARALALEGDLAGAVADVAKQVGGPQALNQMNSLQRKALADSIGVSVDELAKLASGKLEVKSDVTSPQEANTDAIKKLLSSNKGLITATGILTAATLALAAVMAKDSIMKGIGKVKDLFNPTVTKGVFKSGKRAGQTYYRSGGQFVSKQATGFASSRAAGLLRGAAKVGGYGLAGQAAGMGEDYLREKEIFGKKGSAGDKTVGVLGDAAEGAAYGAMIGSIIPGVGTALGAGIGGILGGVKGLIDEGVFKRDKKMEDLKKEEADARQKVLDENKDLSREDRAAVVAAMEGGAVEMQKLVAQFDSWKPWDDKNQVAEALKELIAKQEEIKNATKEGTKATSDLVLE